MKEIFQIGWLLSGLLLLGWYYKKEGKIDWADILLAIMGPIGWTSVIAAGLFMRRKGYNGDDPWHKLACESVIVGTWLLWAVAFFIYAKMQGKL